MHGPYDVKFTLKYSTTSSNKMTLSHHFLERCIAEGVIQVAMPLFWGGSIPYWLFNLAWEIKVMHDEKSWSSPRLS